MKNLIPRGIALAIAGFALAVHAQNAQYATILQQPQDQCLPLGSTATYSVVATNATSYQWMFNGTALDGGTNSSLVISNIALSNVGYYSAFVYDGADSVPTRSAALDVYVAGGSTGSSGSTSGTSGSPMRSSMMMSPMDSGGGFIVVFGGPIASGGGSGSCPGRYSGYVNYVPPSGWGYLPSTNTTTYSATDTNATNTKLEYFGMYGDVGCNLTTVTIPYPAYSPQYRFSVFFPSGTQVPTNAYPIILTGFNYTVVQ